MLAAVKARAETIGGGIGGDGGRHICDGLDEGGPPEPVSSTRALQRPGRMKLGVVDGMSGGAGTAAKDIASPSTWSSSSGDATAAAPVPGTGSSS